MTPRPLSSSTVHSGDYDAQRTPTGVYRGGFFDQIYASWIGSPEPVWILGGGYAVYQILIGLRSEAPATLVWPVAALCCLAVVGRRRYWYIAVPLVLVASGIATYAGDVALTLLAAYILAFSSISLLDIHKTLGVLVALGAGVAGATLYEDIVFGKTFLIPALTVFVLTCLTGALVRMRANSISAKQKQQAMLAQLRERESQAKANEKATQMATTLHDSVGHSLTAIVSLTEGIQAVDSLDGELRDMVELINEYARSGLRQTRTLVTAIAEGQQDETQHHTLEEIRQLLQGIKQLGIHAELDISPSVPASGMHISLTYRIIREAITNTLKHATGATTITVRIATKADTQLELTVTDNGQRSALHERTPSTGYGLARIRADLTNIGGSMHVGPDNNGGWKLQALIPQEASR